MHPLIIVLLILALLGFFGGYGGWYPAHYGYGGAQRTLDQISTPSPNPAIEANRLINRRLCENVLREARAKLAV